MMVKFNFFCFVFFSVFSFAQSTYYLDATTGDDTNIGDTPANAWKSLNKISQTNLGPGDQVLFKSDEQFNGHFIVNGSGSLSHPIIISSYGIMGDHNWPLVLLSKSVKGPAIYCLSTVKMIM